MVGITHKCTYHRVAYAYFHQHLCHINIEHRLKKKIPKKNKIPSKILPKTMQNYVYKTLPLADREKECMHPVHHLKSSTGFTKLLK